VAPVFAALGNETRLRLVERLCADGPQTITRLTRGTSVTRQAVTKHLRVLAGAGLVRTSGSGHTYEWVVEMDGLDETRRWLDVIGGQWDEALARLKASVERRE
jgi:DNA-binding transcriptional ArsR family regulator